MDRPGSPDREAALNGHSIGGLLALNALFWLVGMAILFAVRGWRTWGEVGRLAGCAYLVGLVGVVVLGTEVLSLGGDTGLGVVLALCAAAIVAGAAVGRRLGRPLPAATPRLAAREPFLLVGVWCAAVAAVLVESFVRIATTVGVWEWDAWAFWVPKAEGIYYFGGLDPQLFRHLAAPSYPILVPTLEAMDFHFMGSADTVTLRLQFWLLMVGFVLTVAGLLRPAVPLALVWPFLGLMLLMPEFDLRALATQADVTLDYLFVAAALAVALWLVRKEGWYLAVAGVFLAGAMSTKREGVLLAGCLLVAGLLGAVPARRGWHLLLGTTVAVYLSTIPWRVWWSGHGFKDETSPVSISDLWRHSDRAWPGFKLVLRLAFNYDSWLVAVPLGVVAALLLLAAGRRLLPVFFFALVGLVAAGFTWIVWSISTLPLNTSDQTPLPRAVGALVLLSIALGPLMVHEALEASRRQPETAAAPA